MARNRNKITQRARQCESIAALSQAVTNLTVTNQSQCHTIERLLREKETMIALLGRQELERRGPVRVCACGLPWPHTDRACQPARKNTDA